MKRITCENCGKSYDFDRDEFCPKCGTFNQPVKTWGVDARGNVVRVDGVNESGHDGSFVHKEFHHEQDVRKRTGMDWQKPKAAAPQRPQQPVFRDVPECSGPTKKKTNRKSPLVTIAIIFGIIFLMNFLFPLLLMLLS